jgi:predicted restriction endonuclease
MPVRKRPTITPKTRLRIFGRDNFKCTICGASPAFDTAVCLEIDHHVPFSHGGADEDANYRTLCRQCNRGKGNDEALNKTLDSDLLNRLNRVNPEIVKTMAEHGQAVVVANSEEFAEIQKLNRMFDGYEITLIPNTIMGFHAGFNMGIYTLEDNGGAKVNFRIAPRG